MNKQEFLAELRGGLSGLPEADIEERIAFYGEMIDDRIEEGLTEEAAISDIGTAEDIIEQITAEIPLAKIVKERIRPKKKLKAWEIVLLVIFSPVWICLLIALFAAVLSVYIVLWAVIIVLWAVFAALALGGICAVVGGILFTVNAGGLPGPAFIGLGIFCMGLSIFMFFGCRAASKGIIKLTGEIAVGIKRIFIRKEAAK